MGPSCCHLAGDFSLSCQGAPAPGNAYCRPHAAAVAVATVDAAVAAADLASVAAGAVAAATVAAAAVLAPVSAAGGGAAAVVVAAVPETAIPLVVAADAASGLTRPAAAAAAAPMADAVAVCCCYLIPGRRSAASFQGHGKKTGAELSPGAPGRVARQHLHVPADGERSLATWQCYSRYHEWRPLQQHPLRQMETPTLEWQSVTQLVHAGG